MMGGEVAPDTAMEAPNPRPLDRYFRKSVHLAMRAVIPKHADARVEDYLVDLLNRFVHTDSIFAIRDASQSRLKSVVEMLAEGDIQIRANSFERERLVHRHIGDYILFWSGVYPRFLTQLKALSTPDLLCDYLQQGKESYYFVSLFQRSPYEQEAALFRELSTNFERYTKVLNRTQRELPRAFGA